MKQILLFLLLVLSINAFEESSGTEEDVNTASFEEETDLDSSGISDWDTDDSEVDESTDLNLGGEDGEEDEDEDVDLGPTTQTGKLIVLQVDHNTRRQGSSDSQPTIPVVVDNDGKPKAVVSVARGVNEEEVLDSVMALIGKTVRVAGRLTRKRTALSRNPLSAVRIGGKSDVTKIRGEDEEEDEELDATPAPAGASPNVPMYPSNSRVKLAVVKVAFSSGDGIEMTNAQIMQRMKTGAWSHMAGSRYNGHVDKYLKESSYNQVQLDFSERDILGSVTIDHPPRRCEVLESWYPKIRAAMRAHSPPIDSSSYGSVIYVVPNDHGCGWAACAFQATYMQATTAIFVCGMSSTASWAHEVGHIIGMNHSPNDANEDWRADGNDEYSDNTCVMGSGVSPYNGPHREQLGWISSAGIHDYTFDSIYAAPRHRVSVTIKSLDSTPSAANKVLIRVRAPFFTGTAGTYNRMQKYFYAEFHRQLPSAESRTLLEGQHTYAQRDAVIVRSCNRGIAARHTNDGGLAFHHAALKGRGATATWTSPTIDGKTLTVSQASMNSARGTLLPCKWPPPKS